MERKAEAASAGSDRRFAVATLAAAGLNIAVFVVRLCVLPVRNRLGHLPDDSFYYLSLARNYAELHVWSFDGGFTRTSGYHILYAYLLVPLTAVFKDLWTLLVATTLLSTSLTLAAVLFGVRLIARAGGGAPEILGVALVLGMWVNSLNSTIVMEWPVTILFSAVYLGIAATPELRSSGAQTILLLLTGIGAPLARLELAATPCVILAVTLLALFLRRTDFSLRPLIAGAAGSIAGALLAVFHHWHYTGQFAMSSGATKLQWSAANGHSPAPFLIEVLLGMTPLTPPHLGLTRNKAAIMLALAVAVALGVVLLWKAGPAMLVAARATSPRWKLTGVWSVCLLATFTITYSFNSAAIDTWYTGTIAAPMALVAGGFIRIYANNPGRWRLARVGAGIFLASQFFFLQWKGEHRPEQERLDILAQLAPAQTGNARIGSFNAGLLGFLQKNRVTNLDGLVNNDIGAYRRTGSIGCYLVDKQLEYLEDWAKTPALSGQISDARGALEGTLTEIVRVPSPEDSKADAVLWRVDLPRLRATAGCDSR